MPGPRRVLHSVSLNGPLHREAQMPEWLGFLLLVVGIVVAAALAIIVTRWALHMNE